MEVSVGWQVLEKPGTIKQRLLSCFAEMQAVLDASTRDVPATGPGSHPVDGRQSAAVITSVA